MPTRIIGLGNPILQDDGVGVYAARALRRYLPPGAPVDVIELAVGGLGLMEAMIGCERVIIIDALWSPNGNVGEVVVFDAGDLPGTMNAANAHNADLPTALKAGRALGAPLPADDAIHIVGVRARHVLDFGERPTPPVLAALPEAVGAVLTLLEIPLPPAFPPPEVLLGGGFDDFT